MRWLEPVDQLAVLDAASSRLVVTIEDHFLRGGLYTIIAETLLHHHRTANVLPMALEERWFTPTLLPQLLEVEGFSAPQIANRVQARLAELV